MRTHVVRGAAVVVGLLWAAGAAHAAEIAWAKSFQAAMTQAKSSKKLVMADFYTDWCGWCKKLDKDTYTNAQVIQLTGQFVPVKVNAEKEGVAVAKKYGVNGYPTILFITPEGDVAGKIGGYMPPEPFAGELKNISTSYKEFPVLEARYKANPNDSEAAVKLAMAYAGRGNAEKAGALLAQAEKSESEKTQSLLPKAYNAVADCYQEKEQFDKAIPLFRKAAKLGKEPYDVAYAHISIASCYLSMAQAASGQAERDKNIQAAIPELEATAAVPNGPKDLKEQAEQMLKQLRR
jgi:thioredoxin-related protein